MTTSVLSGPDSAGLVHQALLYESPLDFARTVAPYVREGVERDDAVLVITSQGNLEALSGELTPAQAAAIDLRPAEELYRQPGRALASYHELLTEHAGGGRTLRVVGEQPLTTLHADQVRELCRIDAAFNEVCAMAGISVVCPYDLSLPSHVIDSVRRSHPQIADVGLLRASPDYRPPHELLGEERRGSSLSAPQGPQRELIRPSRPAEVRAFVLDSARQVGLGPVGLDDFLVAVNEVAANAFLHADMDRIRVWRDDDRLVCEVHDRGTGLTDPLVGYRQPGREATHGRGMWLAQQMADLVEVRTGPTGSTLRLHCFVDRLPSGAAGGADPAEDGRSGWFIRPEHVMSTLRSLGIPAAVEGRDGRLLAANAAAVALFAPDLHDVRGVAATRIWQRTTTSDGAPTAPPPTAHTLRTGDLVADVPLHVRSATGEPLELAVTSTPVFRPGDDAPYAAVVTFQPRALPARHAGRGRAGKSGRPGQVRPRAFLEHVTAALDQPARGDVAVTRIDLDDTAAIDRRYGSAVTDAVLGIIARRLQRALRPQDVFARFGSDDFAVLTVGVPPADLARLTGRMEAAMTRPVRLDETDVPIRVRASLATHVASAGQDAMQVLESAAAALRSRRDRARTAPASSQVDGPQRRP